MSAWPGERAGHEPPPPHLRRRAPLPGERAFGASARAAGASHPAVVALLGRLADAGIDFVKMEGLYSFDGEPGYSAAQGQ